MIGARINAFVTFDRAIIHRNWNAINESAGKKAGLLVRRIARNSLRQVKHGRPSAPGMPPHSHAWRYVMKSGRRKATTAPLRLIYSVPEMMGARVIVGPVGFGDVHPVPEVHERGLTVPRMVPKRGAKAIIDKRTGRKRFIRERRLVKYPARPFMWPALVKATPKLPAMWYGSLGG
jgi:hypothetical protein